MVRRRGRPRRSYAYLRIKKYRLKWKVEVLPQRFKLLIRPMAAKIETELGQLDYLELQVFALLQHLGIPEAEWKSYMAFAKKIYETYMDYWYDTAIQESDLLIQEFVLRGLTQSVLEKVRNQVIEKCAIYRDKVIEETLTYNFDDATSQGWKVGAVNIGLLPCECERVDNCKLQSFFFRSPPYSIMFGVAPWGTHTYGGAQLFDFTKWFELNIEGYVYDQAGPRSIPNLKCYDCETLEKTFDQTETTIRNVWKHFEYDLTEACKGRKICMVFSKGFGSGVVFWDDIIIKGKRYE